MSKKYMLLSLEDERIKSIAEILGNKTSNKIINFLTEKNEASEKDIADGLKMPLNTVEYNLNKMKKAGIIEESKNFFWSPKGRKIKMYRFSNKSIVISPKNTNLSSEIKQIIPVALMSGLAAVGVRYYFTAQQAAQSMQEDTALFAASKASETAAATGQAINIINTGNYWLWFLAGAIFAVTMFVLKMMLYDMSWQPQGEKR